MRGKERAACARGRTRRALMDLTAQLINPSKSLQNLLSLPWPESRKKSARFGTPWIPERRLGDVRDAMIAVLGEEGDPLRVADIYARVQTRLEGPVSYQHVKDFLNHRSRGDRRLFERHGYGRYGLYVRDGRR